MKNLKILREARGLSQQKLAEHFCLSQQSIYKYENGLAEPNFVTLQEFAEFFHTSIDFLIGYSNVTLDDDTIRITPKSIQEAHHLDLYRKLSPQNQQHLDFLLEDLCNKK